MMRKFIFIFVLLMICGFTPNPIYAQKGCEYDRNGYREVPRSSTLVEINAGKFRQMKGRIDKGGSPLLIASLYRKSKTRRIFVGSQKVDQNGWFCFKNLPAGKYLMKLGGDIQLVTADVYITIAPKNKKASGKNIEITLGLAI